MLSLGYKKINFQVANEIAYDQLLQHVGETVEKHPDTARDNAATPVGADTQTSAFQVGVTFSHIKNAFRSGRQTCFVAL